MTEKPTDNGDVGTEVTRFIPVPASVSPQAQGSGVGSALMEAALRFCREHDHLKVTLDTFMEREPAVSLFKKFRFHPGRTKRVQGKELVYFHGQKDFTRIVEENDDTKVGKNQTILVTKDRTEEVAEGNDSHKVTKGNFTMEFSRYAPVPKQEQDEMIKKYKEKLAAEAAGRK